MVRKPGKNPLVEFVQPLIEALARVKDEPPRMRCNDSQIRLNCGLR